MKKCLAYHVPDGIPVSLTVKLCQSSSISGPSDETDIRKNINNLVLPMK
jgi:hypothetical protein